MSVSVREIKTRVILDFGPSTVIILSELLLVILKILGHINYSWTLVLSPIILTIIGASLILFFTLVKIIKDNLF
jgi:uncharacterized membrane protein